MDKKNKIIEDLRIHRDTINEAKQEDLTKKIKALLDNPKKLKVIDVFKLTDSQKEYDFVYAYVADRLKSLDKGTDEYRTYVDMLNKYNEYLFSSDKPIRTLGVKRIIEAKQEGSEDMPPYIATAIKVFDKFVKRYTKTFTLGEGQSGSTLFVRTDKGWQFNFDEAKFNGANPDAIRRNLIDELGKNGIDLVKKNFGYLVVTKPKPMKM